MHERVEHIFLILYSIKKKLKEGTQKKDGNDEKRRKDISALRIILQIHPAGNKRQGRRECMGQGSTRL